MSVSLFVQLPANMSLCLAVCQSIDVCVCVFACLFCNLSVSLSLCLSLCLSLSVSLSVSVCLCLSLCMCVSHRLSLTPASFQCLNSFLFVGYASSFHGLLLFPVRRDSYRSDPNRLFSRSS